MYKEPNLYVFYTLIFQDFSLLKNLVVDCQIWMCLILSCVSLYCIYSWILLYNFHLFCSMWYTEPVERSICRAAQFRSTALLALLLVPSSHLETRGSAGKRLHFARSGENRSRYLPQAETLGGSHRLLQLYGTPPQGVVRNQTVSSYSWAISFRLSVWRFFYVSDCI